MNLLRSGLWLSLAMLLSGCGIANVHRLTYWRATLDRMPDSECIRGAAINGLKIGLPNQTSRSRFLHKPTVNLAYPISFLVDGTEMSIWLVFVARENEPIEFRVVYGGNSSQMTALDSPIRGFIRNIAINCNAPELESRLSRSVDERWDPYFGNI